MIELIQETQPPAQANIKIIGVGGGGGNAINTMISEGLTGVEFIAMNTDEQDLRRSLATHRFQLGAQITKGLGAGANPEVGREAALEDRDRIAELIQGADMVFVAAGMGGGTGTGAAPIIAEVAKECGALTVAVVSKPFNFEGKRRRRQADEGIEAMSKVVDTMITIPNQRLISMATEKTTMKQAFRLADEVLLQATKGVSDLINFQGTVNVDFADVRSIMSEKGVALMGVGTATGEHRVVDAANRAISNPLQDDASIRGATSVLINITGGTELSLWEINEASMLIQEEMHENAEVIWGWVVDEALGDEARVTVIATGLQQSVGMPQAASIERKMNSHLRRTQVGQSAGAGARHDLVASGYKNNLDFDLPTFRNHD